MKPELTKKAIAANIEAMRQLLTDAVIRTSEAFQAVQAGEQNQAIGAMLDLDQDLEDVLALHRAAVALLPSASRDRDQQAEADAH